jgi:hypothetical protein
MTQKLQHLNILRKYTDFSLSWYNLLANWN